MEKKDSKRSFLMMKNTFRHWGMPVFLISILILVFIVSSIRDVYAFSLDVRIPKKYQTTQAGEDLYFEVIVKWPENDVRKDLRFEYFVFDKDDNEISYMKSLKAIETQASFMDTISIPDSASKGMHRLIVNVSDYEDMDKQAVVSFTVNNTIDTVTGYLIAVIAVLAVAVVFLVIEMFQLIRNKMN